jgi:hypothetical protein
MLWKIIIIAIEACVGIDTSQKIKWFIMNGIFIEFIIHQEWLILFNMY